ncbi:rhomboid-like protein [Candidatus Protofrankia datiscae]|nr:rhomboid-like protein [Candidatus Protofrankia datiscae]
MVTCRATSAPPYLHSASSHPQTASYLQIALSRARLRPGPGPGPGPLPRTWPRVRRTASASRDDPLARAWRAAPLAMAYLCVLSVTSAMLAVVHRLDQDAYQRLLRSRSTNLAGLRSRPLYVLVASAFWLERGTFPQTAAAVAALLAPLERVAGPRPALGVFASGHVGASLLVAGGLLLGQRAGLVGGHVTDAVDVGASYGLIACAAVLAATARAHRRWPLVGGLLAPLVLAAVHTPDFTAAGHLIAAGIGLACVRYLRLSYPLSGAIPSGPSGPACQPRFTGSG